MSPLIILFGFAITMIGLSYFSRRSNVHSNLTEFLASSRDVGVLRGAFSIAISWVWAPAIFIAGLQAYTQGLAGAFWFIVPNIACFFLFAIVAKRLRQKFPDGFTLPQFIRQKFKTKRTHYAFLTIFMGYQLGAIIINAVAGGTLITLLTGIDYSVAVLAISGTALIYSMIGGMRASVLTDVIQMVIVLGLACVLVPWTIIEAGGISAITGGFGGVDGGGANFFDPTIAWAFGIPMTISLLSGPIGDQQFFQRAFAVKKSAVSATFNWGGILFGIIPILMCSFGFIAANPEFGIVITDPQMVAPEVIGHFLPSWVLGFFTLMTFAGLCSTIDSAYCAIAGFAAIDCFEKDTSSKNSTGCHPELDSGSLETIDTKKIRFARVFMFTCGIFGTGFALLEPKLLWVFLLYGALVAIGFVPTLFSIFSDRYTERSAFWSIVLGLGAFPFSVWANIMENTDGIVWSAILSVGIGLVVSVVGFLLSTKK